MFAVFCDAVQALNPMPAVVYASSSSVYGLNTKQPFSETDPVEKPASLYASTKRVRVGFYRCSVCVQCLISLLNSSS